MCAERNVCVCAERYVCVHRVCVDNMHTMHSQSFFQSNDLTGLVYWYSEQSYIHQPRSQAFPPFAQWESLGKRLTIASFPGPAQLSVAY